MSYAGHHPIHTGLQNHSVGGLFPFCVVFIGDAAIACHLSTDTYFVKRGVPDFSYAAAVATAEHVKATHLPLVNALPTAPPGYVRWARDELTEQLDMALSGCASGAERAFPQRTYVPQYVAEHGL